MATPNCRTRIRKSGGSAVAAVATFEAGSSLSHAELDSPSGHPGGDLDPEIRLSTESGSPVSTCLASSESIQVVGGWVSSNAIAPIACDAWRPVHYPGAVADPPPRV